MNTLHAVIVLLLGAAFLACILRAVYRQDLRIAYSLLWLAIATALFCTPWLYGLFTWLHERAGWPTPTSQIFLLAILLLLILVFHLSIVVSALWRRQRLLARQLALLQARLDAATDRSQPAESSTRKDALHASR